MRSTAFEKHRQFIRELRRKGREIEREDAERANTAASDDEDYDFFLELDDVFEDLYGSKKEDGQS